LANDRGGNVGAMNVSKALYKPLSIATSVAGGLLAGKIFTEIWQRVNPSNEEPPEPQDLSRSTREAFIAAAVQGLIVGVIRAALARAEAHGYRALTNEDPS
jgi:Na+/proline symporter